jgi:DinB superfamily
VSGDITYQKALALPRKSQSFCDAIHSIKVGLGKTSALVPQKRERVEITIMTEQALLTSALNSWKTNVERADRLFSPASEEQLQKEVAPGKNRLIYLWGHLTAVHDRMLPLLSLGERLHPELDAPFLTNPDRAIPDLPKTEEIKKSWNEINSRLLAGFESFSATEWLQKHASVSDEDFAKDPSRNRFAILLSRTNHLSFHLGQTALISK